MGSEEISCLGYDEPLEGHPYRSVLEQKRFAFGAEKKILSSMMEEKAWLDQYLGVLHSQNHGGNVESR